MFDEHVRVMAVGMGVYQYAHWALIVSVVDNGQWSKLATTETTWLIAGLSVNAVVVITAIITFIIAFTLGSLFGALVNYCCVHNRLTLHPATSKQSKSLTQQAIPPAVYDDIGIVHSGDIPLKQNAAYGPIVVQ